MSCEKENDGGDKSNGADSLRGDDLRERGGDVGQHAGKLGQRVNQRKTHVVLPTVNSLALEPRRSCPALGAVTSRIFVSRLRDVHRDPDKAIETEDEVDAAGERLEVRLESREERGWEGEEVAVSKLKRSRTFRKWKRQKEAKERKVINLAVSERTGMKRHGAVAHERLNLGDEKLQT